MKYSKADLLNAIKENAEISDETKVQLLEDIEDSMSEEVDMSNYISVDDHEKEVGEWKQKYIDRFGVEADKVKEGKKEEEEEEKTLNLYEE